MQKIKDDYTKQCVPQVVGTVPVPDPVPVRKVVVAVPDPTPVVASIPANSIYNFWWGMRNWIKEIIALGGWSSSSSS